MYWKSDWQQHSSDNSPECIGTHYGDPEYSTFQSTAFRLPDGWCFSCLFHQVSQIVFLANIYLSSIYRNTCNIPLYCLVNIHGEASS